MLRPFKALRPRPEIAGAVSAPCSSVSDDASARELLSRSPHSFLRVVRPQVEANNHDEPLERLLERSQQNLAKFLSDGIIVEDTQSALYIYRLAIGELAQTGIVGCISLRDYESGLIKKHENTIAAREEECLRFILAVGVQTSAVFLAYREVPELTCVITDEQKNASPIYDFVAEDGVQHTVWRVTQSARIESLCEQIPSAYIADGHHRLASSNQAQKKLRAETKAPTGREDYNFALAALFPHNQLHVFPYHRLIHFLPMEIPALLKALERDFEVIRDGKKLPQGKGSFCLFLPGACYSLQSRTNEESYDNPVDGLEVTILKRKVLTPIFGIGDSRLDGRVTYLAGSKGTDELERRVNRGEAACAFSLHPTNIEEIMAIADRGMVMEPKSTWFEPKHRSGVLMHRFR